MSAIGTTYLIIINKLSMRILDMVEFESIFFHLAKLLVVAEIFAILHVQEVLVLLMNDGFHVGVVVE